MGCPVSEALDSVIAERVRQDKKWGEQNHDPFTYATILMEEVGEFCQEALRMRYEGQRAPHSALSVEYRTRLREEAVQVAAVALAIVENIDRLKWAWPHFEHENPNWRPSQDVSARQPAPVPTEEKQP